MTLLPATWLCKLVQERLKGLEKLIFTHLYNTMFDLEHMEPSFNILQKPTGILGFLGRFTGTQLTALSFR